MKRAPHDARFYKHSPRSCCICCLHSLCAWVIKRERTTASRSCENLKTLYGFSQRIANSMQVGIKLLLFTFELKKSTIKRSSVCYNLLHGNLFLYLFSWLFILYWILFDNIITHDCEWPRARDFQTLHLLRSIIDLLYMLA